MPELLTNLKDEEFANHKDAIMKSKVEPPKTLRAESGVYWNEIAQGTYDFHRDAIDAEVVKILTKQDVLDYWMKTFDASARAGGSYLHRYGPRILPCRTTRRKGSMGGGFNTLTALMRCSSISALLRPSLRRHAVIGDEARCDYLGRKVRLIRDVGLVRYCMCPLH